MDYVAYPAWLDKSLYKYIFISKWLKCIVSNLVDYCNSLFGGLSRFNLRKMHSGQNSAASIMSKTTKLQKYYFCL